MIKVLPEAGLWLAKQSQLPACSEEGYHREQKLLERNFQVAAAQNGDQGQIDADHQRHVLRGVKPLHLKPAVDQQQD